MRRILLCLFVLAVWETSPAQDPGFATENAFSILTTLAAEIGPRPMGSPAEQRALAFAVSKFREYGCQESYIMPFTVAEGVNTRSGVAVGVLKGKTGRIIVIGGHIDSSGPDIPGANDDGSGVACVLEIARVMGTREHSSTLVFCCWGGEEMGLRGSEYFVDHFPMLDSVDLMLQIDMADGSGELLLDPDGGYQLSAPRWLVESALELFYDQLRYEGLYYPTQAATLNSIGEGSTGSDHMPFIRRGIPAVDFTSDVSYPIHTPLDNIHTFNPAGLKRTGDLVIALANRFDAGVPSRSTEKYWLLQVGSHPLFFSHGTLLVFVLAALGFAMVLLVRLWMKREKVDPALKIRWSGLKVLLVLFMIQLCAWSSTILVSILSGDRFPWVNNFGGFVLLGILAGLIGFWVGLQILTRLRTAADPAPFLLRALVLLGLITMATLAASVELAVYPAAALLLITLMGLVRDTWLRLIMFVVAVVIIWKLIFFEYLGLLQHGLLLVRFDSFWQDFLYHFSFAVSFTLISLPFAYAAVAIHHGSSSDVFWLERFRTWRGIALTGGLFLVLAVFLAGRETYDRFWQPTVRVHQVLTVGEDTAAVEISSGEYLAGLVLSHDGRDTTFQGRVNKFTLHPLVSPSDVWPVMTPTTSEEPLSDSLRAVTRRLDIDSRVPPYTVSVTYRSPEPFEASSSWARRQDRRAPADSTRVKSFYWYSFPEMPLVVPVTFKLKPGQKVTERVEVTYDTLAYPLQLQRSLTTFMTRTVVSAVDTL